jgi:hypothetical protein
MTPEMRAQLEAFKAVKVKHPRLAEVDQQVSQAIAEHAGYAHLLVYGPSGVGKSTMIHQITERLHADAPHRSVVPVVLVEARPSDTGTYVRLDYYRQVLTALKEHVVVKELLVNIATAAKPTRTKRDATDWLDLREAVEHALVHLQVQAVVIDEAQHLMQGETRHRPVDQLDWLKSMTNRTNTLHVLVGTYEVCDFRNLNGQAARRGRDLHFPRYHVETVTERQAFVGAVRYLLAQVPLRCDTGALLERWRWLAEASVGCVGILKDWLVATVAATLHEGGTTLTSEALARYALQPAQRVRLELDARAGEHKVDTWHTTSAQQLQALLGHPDRIGVDAGPAPDARPKPPSRRRVGERVPSRDPVGGDTPEVHATHCAFAGAVDVEPARLLHTAIRAMECPVCGAVRTVALHGMVLRFPRHKPLLTRTTKNVSRWVRQETLWALWEKQAE